MSPTMMDRAIASTGHSRRPGAEWPRHGVVRVQWGGPWLKPGVPPRVAYGFTHWVASRFDPADEVWWVFDVNGGWLQCARWEREIVPAILSSIKRADGTWITTHRWEVRRVQDEPRAARTTDRV